MRKITLLMVLIAGVASGLVLQAQTSAPYDLVATKGSEDLSVQLQWSDSASDELGFAIERKINAGSWLKIAEKKADKTTFLDAGVASTLQKGGVFSYRVSAIDTGGNLTAYSNEASVTLSPTVDVLEPIDDAQIRPGDYLNVNFGDSLYMIAKTGGDGIKNPYSRVSFLKFDISGISEDANYANLVLNIRENVNADDTITLYVYYGPAPTWDESTVTFQSIADEYSSDPLDGVTWLDLLTIPANEITSYKYAGHDLFGESIIIDITDAINSRRSLGMISLMLYDKYDALGSPKSMNKIVSYNTKEVADQTVRPRLVYRTPSTQAISQIDGTVKNVSFYPNPVGDILNVELANIFTGVLNISDVNGNLLITEKIDNNNSAIDMSTFSTGMYFVEIISENDTFIGKVIKK